MASAGIPSTFSVRDSIASLPSLLPATPSVSLRPQLNVRALLKRNPKRLKYSTPRLFKKRESMVYVEMDPLGTETWRLDPVVELIKEGAVGVIPTDTVYAAVPHPFFLFCFLLLPVLKPIACFVLIKDIENKKARFTIFFLYESDSFILLIQPLSILCHCFQDIDKYTVGFPRGDGHGQTNIFRAIKHCLPGPYTFILPATKELPKQCIRSGRAAKYESRKHVGIRMPDDPICQAILRSLDEPVISTSVKWPSEDQWMLDPVLIADTYEPEGLDFVVDGGVRVADPSTVVDMTGKLPTIIRQGKGPRLDWMVVEGEDVVL
ncbi:hypothetical protein ZIOFF_069636 [Zingiber officinale]|uniref:Threonylcarbamoyl-AMP synthase n=1 Tax=Zingiber officinale TaxID=94328 RepID=A0A8J5CDX2_ZINOF|nr:hypothetical protein ZIOFF_069636 [Zingiber officinale]